MELRPMELRDTVEMMTSEDHKERFRAEYFQLKLREEKLNDMLYKYRNGTLPFKPKCSIELLTKQLCVMHLYALYLEERAAIEGIDITTQ